MKITIITKECKTKDKDEAMRWTGRHSEWDESWIPYDAYMTY